MRILFMLVLLPACVAHGVLGERSIEAETAGEIEGVEVDGGCEILWFADVDRDGYGDLDVASMGCEPPESGVWTLDGGDCDDLSVAIHPNAIEICDSLDNDCDAEIDENAMDSFEVFVDGDGDGYGAESAGFVCASVEEGTAPTGGDCYDLNDRAHPGASTVDVVDRGDGSYDYNCDGVETPTWGLYQCATPDTEAQIGYVSGPPGCGETGPLAYAFYEFEDGTCTPDFGSSVLAHTQSCS